MYEDAVKDMGFLLFDLDNMKRPFRRNFDCYYEIEEEDKEQFFFIRDNLTSKILGNKTLIAK